MSDSVFGLTIVFLLSFIAVREYIFHKQLDKMVNKIMSRDYWDYSRADKVTHQDIKPVVEIEDPLEDFYNVSI